MAKINGEEDKDVNEDTYEGATLMNELLSDDSNVDAHYEATIDLFANRTAWTRNILLLIGIIFHVTYIFSIFDIYFTSPLVHGMKQHQLAMSAPARRLILFVADGLRADRLFEPLSSSPPTTEDRDIPPLIAADGTQTRAPFLHDVQTRVGSWGVSHTRVPTESRPGHVAIIAGFYEDVSAVTKGWKMNPVDFDSIFNQTKHTWSFGSPDICPLDMFMYSAEEEDFAREASILDTWVFDHFAALLERARTDDKLREQLAQDKIVFFLHLIGLDTNGHAFRPHSKEYLNNIRVVDKGIQRIQSLIEAYYNDAQTAYVFTSDHGMGNRGNSTKRRRTSRYRTINGGPTRLNYPANNVGVLPVEYLNGSDEFRARSALTNAHQILEQFLVKEESKRHTEIAFRPFEPLANQQATHKLNSIEQLIQEKNYETAQKQAIELIHECLRGLRYYQTYDWRFLRSIVSIGYLGWIAYSLLFIANIYVFEGGSQHLTSTTPTTSIDASQPTTNVFIDAIAVISAILLSVMFYIQGSPTMYYLYAIFPIFFWHQVLRNHRTFSRLFKGHSSLNGQHLRRYGWWHTAFYVLLIVGALETLVYSYFERRVLTVCLWLLACWPWTVPASFRAHHRTLVVMWQLSCLVTSIFPVLPVEKGDDISLMLLIVVSMITTASSVRRLELREGLPWLNQVIGWTTLGLSLVAPLITSGQTQHYLNRLVTIFLAFSPTFILLSISYEMLFYVAFSCTLACWMFMELDIVNSSSMIYLLFVNVAFFGTGNIASVSSFNLSSVYRLTTTFNPFLMGALLIFKIFIPFFILSAIFGVTSRAIDLPPFSLLLLVLSTTDVMTLNFFFLVRDDGSWLEIGTSISHFCISSGFVVFTTVLFCVSHLMVGHVLVPASVMSRIQKKHT
ncbi:Phosphatidylinositolglycan class N-domain-containing protein [Syncephalis plumigaleata]|nr:Phosphatidylinositolglycan class N-domain-containing protein [Syncephalis plumigaleata]